MDTKARKTKILSTMSAAAGQLFRMLERNSGSELMVPEDNECSDALVVAAHELSKELNLKEVFLKAQIPDLGNEDLGLYPSCANYELEWYSPNFKKRKLDETSQEGQNGPKDTDEVEFLGVEQQKNDHLSLMDIWKGSERHVKLFRFTDMLTPDIEIVWEGKARQGLPDDKSEEQAVHDLNQVVVEKQGKRMEIGNRASGRGQRSDKRIVVTPPQTRSSSRHLRSSFRYLPNLSVTPAGKTNKR